METHFRSIIKAITWRTGGTIVTFGVALFVAKDVGFAAKIGLLDTLVKLVAFYFHERIWNKNEKQIQKSHRSKQQTWACMEGKERSMSLFSLSPIHPMLNITSSNMQELPHFQHGH